MNILLVDDEPLIRLGVGTILMEFGHHVLDVATGKQALDYLAHHPEIELLLTDFQMPGISGLELVELCRKSYPNLRIILMTGYYSSHHTFPDDCPVRLAKPFSVQNLTEAIDQLFLESINA
jgi:CheY-like chemotaxis protein